MLASEKQGGRSTGFRQGGLEATGAVHTRNLTWWRAPRTRQSGVGSLSETTTQFRETNGILAGVNSGNDRLMGLRSRSGALYVSINQPWPEFGEPGGNKPGEVTATPSRNGMK
jgi:hypothetical protein